MKILLIMPDARIHKMKLWGKSVSFREAPLTLTTLAALVPEELDACIKIIDESVDQIPFNEEFDLVGISCLTGTATRAYEIAGHFRNQGSTVVLGGVHVSLMPEEAMQHAHSIIKGFAEETWPQLLKDFSEGKLKQVYESNQVNIEHVPLPRRDLQKKFSYLNPNTVFATRGCKKSCDFCTVSAVPFGWHTRPVLEVIDEIRAIKGKRIVFNDVSLLEDREYAKELFKALIPLKKMWGGLCTTQIGQDEEMLDLMRESGCVYLLIGFESVSNSALYAMRKSFNDNNSYAQLVSRIHERGIIIQGCFVFGFDNDDKDVFRKTVDAVNELKIDIPRYAVYTPYPKTKAYERLKSTGRLLHEKWEYYDTQHVVFQPAQMSAYELDEGFKWAYRETFRLNSIHQRLRGGNSSFLIRFFGNLAYRLYIRRLYADKNRFPKNININNQAASVSILTEAEEYSSEDMNYPYVCCKQQR